MRGGQPSTPTDAEIQRLRALRDLREEIARCRFVTTWNGKAAFVTWNKNGVTTPDYDWEDFRSYLTVLRKLVLQEAPTHLFSIGNIVWRCDALAGPRERQLYGRLREIAAKGEKDVEHWIVNHGTAHERTFSKLELFDLIVNAEVFHNDEGRRAQWLAVKDDRALWMSMVVAHTFNLINFATFLLWRAAANGWIAIAGPATSGESPGT